MNTIKKHNVDPAKVNEGDLMAFIYWTKVKSTSSNGSALGVANLDDDEGIIRINGKELIEKSFSADQYHEEEKVGKTRAAEILLHSVNRPFTVCFLKTNGSERVLRGRLVKPEPLLGRSMVEDLDQKGVNRLRQVDHRTIKYLIVDGTKYVVK
jgi:hypothetical protein